MSSEEQAGQNNDFMKKYILGATVILTIILLFIYVLTTKKQSSLNQSRLIREGSEKPISDQESSLAPTAFPEYFENNNQTTDDQKEIDKNLIESSNQLDASKNNGFGKGGSSDFAVSNFVSRILNIFNSFPANQNPQINPTPIINLSGYPNPSAFPTYPGPSTGKVYYSQCSSSYSQGSWGNIPLPGGCNVCQAGCGPTTVAMILAYYINHSHNPQTVVNDYRTVGYELDCGGSSYYDAKALLERNGLTTSPYIINYDYGQGVSINQVVNKFRSYIGAGSTIFVLADFAAGGHYFWIVDIDSSGHVWAYDPYYGRWQLPPFDENSKYPYPKYRTAFAVSK